MSKSTIYYIENKNLKKVGMQDIIKDFMMKRLEYFLGKDIILNDFTNCKDFGNTKNFDDLIILIDLSCPMLDEKLIHDMIDFLGALTKK